MDHTEFDDFKTEITKYGHTIDDFTLNEIDLTNWQPNKIRVIQGLIDVKRISTNKVRTYRAGNGTHWVVDFSDDLKSGLFN